MFYPKAINDVYINLFRKGAKNASYHTLSFQDRVIIILFNGCILTSYNVCVKQIFNTIQFIKGKYVFVYLQSVGYICIRVESRYEKFT